MEQTPNLVIPADPKRVLLPLSLVMVVGAALVVGAMRVSAEVLSARQAIEENIEAVESLRTTMEAEVLKRDEFEVWKKRMRDLNPELRWPD